MTQIFTKRKRFLLIAFRLTCLILSMHVIKEGFIVWVEYGFFSFPSLYSTVVNTMIFSLSIYIFNNLEKFLNVIGISIFLGLFPYLLLQEASKFLGLDFISNHFYQYQAYSTRNTDNYDIDYYPTYGFTGNDYDQVFNFDYPLVPREVLELGTKENQEYSFDLQNKYEVVNSEMFVFWQSALIKGYSSDKEKDLYFLDFLLLPLAYFLDVVNDITPLILIVLLIHAFTFAKGYLNYFIE